MVDARFPEKLLMDRRLVRLSPIDFRSYVMATIWSVSNRTDGCLMPDDLALIPTFEKDSAPRLVAAQLWTELGAGYLIVDFEAQQTSKHDLEVLESARRREREKKNRQRAKKRDESPGQSPGTNEGTTQDRPGQARQGQAQEREVITEWNVAPIGEGRLAS